MSDATFSKKKAITFGWNTVQIHFFYFLGLIALTWIIPFVLGFISEEVKEYNVALSAIVFIISWIISIIINLGLIYISLRFCDEVRPRYRELLTPANHFLSFVAASVLYFLIVFFGLLLFVVPGIIWSMKYGMYRYLIVDKGMGPLEALRKSGEITKGSKWNLFLLILLLSLINIVGALVFVVGLFVTIPLTMLAMAYTYRTLLVASSSSQHTHSE